jgi:hypothetical protein
MVFGSAKIDKRPSAPLCSDVVVVNYAIYRSYKNSINLSNVKTLHEVLGVHGRNTILFSKFVTYSHRRRLHLEAIFARLVRQRLFLYLRG